jgi:long-chain acyl-CoA synthetase
LIEAVSAADAGAPRSHQELSQNPIAIKLVQRDVAAMTGELNDYERVKRVALLPSEFTIDGGELTPTLKVKRRVVDEKYEAVIDDLYGVA